MAWNPSPEVAVARDAARQLGSAPMCIVFWITDEAKIGMATYGATKVLCAEAKKLGEAAWEAMMEGHDDDLQREAMDPPF